MHMARDWLGRRAAYTPDRTALIVEPGGTRYTYRDLDQRACRTARALAALGVGPGDRVALVAHNCLAHLDLLWACAKLGAIFVPLNWRLALAELVPQVLDAAPTVLVYGAPFAAAGAAAAAEGVRSLSVDDLAAACAEQPADPWPEAPSQPGDPWLILYTGGTTGRAKGAVLTHGSVAANAFNTITGWQLRPDDVAPILLPLFHTGGLNVLTTPLTVLGASQILVEAPSFDPALALDVVARHQATLLFLVPTMYQMLIQHPAFAGANLGSLRLCITGGAPCPLPVMEAFWERGILFKVGYGLTEAGPNNFAMPDGQVRAKPGSVGLPLPLVQARLMGPDGQDLPPGQVGELLLAGPHLFAGYWRNPEATQAVLRDGWLHTGDLAVRDAEGFYAIVDRKKDMFISGGENVYPAEVEAVLCQHPAVLECAVVGVPDPLWGEVGKAVVVLRPGHTASAEALAAYCRERLARYKVPRHWEFRDALPKSAAGKVLRRELRGG